MTNDPLNQGFNKRNYPEAYKYLARNQSASLLPSEREAGFTYSYSELMQFTQRQHRVENPSYQFNSKKELNKLSKNPEALNDRLKSYKDFEIEVLKDSDQAQEKNKKDGLKNKFKKVFKKNNLSAKHNNPIFDALNKESELRMNNRENAIIDCFTPDDTSISSDSVVVNGKKAGSNEINMHPFLNKSPIEKLQELIENQPTNQLSSEELYSQIQNLGGNLYIEDVMEELVDLDLEELKNLNEIAKSKHGSFDKNISAALGDEIERKEIEQEQNNRTRPSFSVDPLLGNTYQLPIENSPTPDKRVTFNPVVMNNEGEVYNTKEPAITKDEDDESSLASTLSGDSMKTVGKLEQDEQLLSTSNQKMTLSSRLSLHASTGVPLNDKYLRFNKEPGSLIIKSDEILDAGTLAQQQEEQFRRSADKGSLPTQRPSELIGKPEGVSDYWTKFLESEQKNSNKNTEPRGL